MDSWHLQVGLEKINTGPAQIFGRLLHQHRLCRARWFSIEGSYIGLQAQRRTGSLTFVETNGLAGVSLLGIAYSFTILHIHLPYTPQNQHQIYGRALLMETIIDTCESKQWHRSRTPIGWQARFRQNSLHRRHWGPDYCVAHSSITSLISKCKDWEAFLVYPKPFACNCAWHVFFAR